MLHFRAAKSIGTLLCLGFLHINTTFARAQEIVVGDTLRLTLPEVEKMFLEKNLDILAERYNIASGEALVEQARKWDNPTLITDQNVYADKGFFQHGHDKNGAQQGQVFVQLQQLITTAGKRARQIDLAKTNVNVADWQFRSVMRNLRAALLTDFYTTAKLQAVGQLYKENAMRLETLLKAQEIELAAGNIARKERLRVQALMVSLQQSIIENEQALADAQGELKTMLQLSGNTFVQPVLPETEPANEPTITLLQAVDSARHNNTNYRIEEYLSQYSQQNLRLQKALAVPDLTVGPEYDQASSYTPNYFGLTLSLPIPLWDRNRGNIKSADYQVKQEDLRLRQAGLKLQNDVMSAYQKLLATVRLSTTGNTSFYTEYYQLQKNITDSYNKRQISLIEFLEYFKDYQNIRETQLQQTLQLRLAKQDLNDVVGVDVVK